MEYKFYGHDTPDVLPINEKFKGVKNQRDLYDRLSKIWCEYTCAPRLRQKWSENNKTVGQCSITAFLVQDVFGGKVYGVPLEDGNYHCYNVVGESVFDLTSEQFEGRKLEYRLENEQLREVHFAKEEKRLRYEYLKDKLNEYCNMPI